MGFHAEFQIGKDPVIGKVMIERLIYPRQFGGQHQIKLIEQHHLQILLFTDALYAVE